MPERVLIGTTMERQRLTGTYCVQYLGALYLHPSLFRKYIEEEAGRQVSKFQVRFLGEPPDAEDTRKSAPVLMMDIRMRTDYREGPIP